MLNRLKEIDKDILDDYDSFYGNYEDQYDEGVDYEGYFGRQISHNIDNYGGPGREDKNFETYKNMFDTENPHHSQEEIDETINSFNNWFENTDFGEDLKETLLDHGRSTGRQQPDFNDENRDFENNFDRYKIGEYKNDFSFNGRSFESFDVGQVQDESKNSFDYAPSTGKVKNENKKVLNQAQKDNIQMKLNNNNLKVTTSKDLVA